MLSKSNLGNYSYAPPDPPLPHALTAVSGGGSNAVSGGVAFVAGGGKFANGAITGAFGYMFNSAGRSFEGRLHWRMGCRLR